MCLQNWYITTFNDRVYLYLSSKHSTNKNHANENIYHLMINNTMWLDMNRFYNTTISIIEPACKQLQSENVYQVKT